MIPLYNSFTKLLFLLAWITYSSCDYPPGHMKPLGSHMDPLYVETTTTFPDPLTFHSNYVEKKWPVIFKGLLRETDAFKNWGSDKYLMDNFGREIVGTENGKKENRSESGEMFSFKEFLNRYNTSDIYLVHDMPESMKKEWPIPSFLLCGGYTENLAYIHMWFSSGGTKSVLHTDSMENFHCVVSGRKEFVMFEPKYSEDIGPEHRALGYYHIDVEAVDMIKYSNLSTIPWYKATVHEGDCLYLPYLWLHHVDSYGRNLGVNIWWIPFEFAKEECANTDFRPGFAKIDQFPISTELPVKQFLIELKRPDGTIHASDVFKIQSERGLIITEENVQELFEIILPGCKGVIKENDLQDLVPLVNFRKALDYIAKVAGDQNEPYEEETPPPNLFPIDEEGGGDGHPHARDEL